jgi:hypothetical protein
MVADGGVGSNHWFWILYLWYLNFHVKGAGYVTGHTAGRFRAPLARSNSTFCVFGFGPLVAKPRIWPKNWSEISWPRATYVQIFKSIAPAAKKRGLLMDPDKINLFLIQHLLLKVTCWYDLLFRIMAILLWDINFEAPWKYKKQAGPQVFNSKPKSFHWRGWSSIKKYDKCLWIVQMLLPLVTVLKLKSELVAWMVQTKNCRNMQNAHYTEQMQGRFWQATRISYVTAVWFILAGPATSDPALWVSSISSTNQLYDSVQDCSICWGVAWCLIGDLLWLVLLGYFFFFLIALHNLFIIYSYYMYQPWRHKGAGTVFFFFFFRQLIVWWSWCGRA